MSRGDVSQQDAGLTETAPHAEGWSRVRHDHVRRGPNMPTIEKCGWWRRPAECAAKIVTSRGSEDATTSGAPRRISRHERPDSQTTTSCARPDSRRRLALHGPFFNK